MGSRARFVSLLLLAGCANFAPPVRGPHYGAPGRLTEGRFEIGGVAAGVNVPAAGGPYLGVAPRDWVVIEAGANVSNVDNQSKWGMGFVGARFAWVPGRDQAVHFVADLEIGVGAGAGGAFQRNDVPYGGCVAGCGDGRTALQRFAGGGYQGLGVGVRVRWFTIFLRARVEETTATNVPLTIWPSLMLGAEAQFSRHFALTLGVGGFGLFNPAEWITAGFYQIGLALLLDGWGRP